ncbi:iron-containing redox enzyme family protein [Leptospira sp. GIMC2001]|uniref:iron-containing redox enzyme family protein n=1 Tax=Leptospira sp. GIMC2001 TaxID=1513297 RepID=UPI00234A1F7B|nr:iron-containing redox enzyme family protein [Leptospira sp. GIMC2001]WCL47954.1 iron-containing redox enzyme family protein [Leptospira sp. GIMC2001]
MENTITITNKLIDQVKGHSILKNEWLRSRQDSISLFDMKLWLSQEYLVSIAFVNWFLIAATKTNDQSAKIILVQNIWEELGEGDLNNTHVRILDDFLNELGLTFDLRTQLEETKAYLYRMEEIVNYSFFHALGALGPANEYLLKLEYFEMSRIYDILKRNIYESKNVILPEPKFFQVNLDADEGHSKRLFDLIEKMAVDHEKRKFVEEGNQWALDAREIFYKGLLTISN